MSERHIHTVAIVGLGLIGSSLAAALRNLSNTVRILGVDVDEQTRTEALRRGWIDQAATGCADEAFESFVRSVCDLVVLAVPASGARPYLEALDRWDFEGIITDTASTKERICRDADEVLHHSERFIPGHPMAGSEVNGIAGARADLFEGAHWILCPNERTPGEFYTALHDLLTGLSARVISLPREEHDRSIALVSHVPHMVASSLVQLVAGHADNQQALFRLAAGGFKDSTRIAAGSPDLWCGIAFDNRDEIARGLDEIRSIIGQFQEALMAGDKKRMLDLLDAAAQARRAIPQKWLPSTDDLIEVRIPLTNRTGAVAEVTTIAGKAGCNIDSIEIDHLTAHSAVLNMVLTDEGDFGRLSTLLLEAGFTVSLSPLSAKE
ncbi:prephenate dehydrogenase/arogenate dehydrogenase family protein [Cryptobacterium curtum]|uniref:prephenate dehydrogenase/arogenate dehydrogenase family protein n=1 Tax=Cryptobacterium curtum TaxID=84163 RepID=UPI0023568DC9|nr:prephenate dehydrogenase/arogenate dehydrogenase family protein [Cryptobacterium curtum]